MRYAWVTRFFATDETNTQVTFISLIVHFLFIYQHRQVRQVQSESSSGAYYKKFKRTFSLVNSIASNTSAGSKLSSLINASLVSIIFLCIGSFFSCLIYSRRSSSVENLSLLHSVNVTKGSFPLIAKAITRKLAARTFIRITIFESTRCKLTFAMSGKEA